MNGSPAAFGPKPFASGKRLLAAVAAATACCAVAILCPAAARASLATSTESSRTPRHEMTMYTAGPGERNRVLANEITIRRQHWVRITDRAAHIEITLNEGCRRRRPSRSQANRTPHGGVTVHGSRFGATIYCKLPESPFTTSPPTGWPIARELVVFLEDKDDVLLANMDQATAVEGFGGGGIDFMSGGAEADNFCSGRYTGTHDGEALDCVPTPEDAGRDDDETPLPFETLQGGKSHDLLLGTDRRDAIRGGDGDDILDAAGGADAVVGGNGEDEINGGDGDDFLETSPAAPRQGEQEREWVGGDDTIKGGDGFDTYGFAFTDQPVHATGRSTNRSGIEGSETDTYSGVELLQLSRSDDVFTGPIGGFDFAISAYGGNDQVDISGDRGPNWNDHVDCGGGYDKAAIDVNRASDPTAIELVGGSVEIQEDGASQCERVDYVAR